MIHWNLQYIFNWVKGNHRKILFRGDKGELGMFCFRKRDLKYKLKIWLLNTFGKYN